MSKIEELNQRAAPSLSRGRKIAEEVLSAFREGGGSFPSKHLGDLRSLVTVAAAIAFATPPRPLEAQDVATADADLRECVAALGLNNNETTRLALMTFAGKIAALNLEIATGDAAQPSTAPAPLVTPTVHLNGTSRESLQAAYEAAYRSLGETAKIVQEAMPNARDYYPQGDSAYAAARDQHWARMRKLEEVRNDMLALFEATEK